MATNEPQVLAEAGSLAQDISLPTIMDANIKVDDIDLYHGNPAKPKILEVTDKIIKGLMEEPQKMSLQEQVKAFLCCKGKYWNKDIQARWVRFWAIGGVPIVMLFIMNELTNGGWGSETYYLGPMLGIGIALMFSFYFVNLIIQLGPGRIFRYLIPKCCQERSKCCDKLANRGKLKYKQDGSENDEASKEDDMGKGEEYFFKIETRLTQGIHFIFQHSNSHIPHSINMHFVYTFSEFRYDSYDIRKFLFKIENENPHHSLGVHF